jgi:hypothetical protein
MKAAGFLPILLLGAVCGLLSEAVGVEAVLRHDVSVSTRQGVRVGKWDAPVLPISETDTIYVQFDVESVLPAGTTAAQVAKASLRFWVSKVSTPGLCGVYPVTLGWTERVPFNPIDGLPATLGSRAALVEAYYPKAFVVADVTQVVRGWLSGTPNYGLALKGDFRGGIVFGSNSAQIVGNDLPTSDLRVPLVARVDSKENTASGHQPVLQIVLSGSNP